MVNVSAASPNSGVLALPMTIAPASRMRVTVGAS
jgi:hypothetical protein